MTRIWINAFLCFALFLPTALWAQTPEKKPEGEVTPEKKTEKKTEKKPEEAEDTKEKEGEGETKEGDTEKEGAEPKEEPTSVAESQASEKAEPKEGAESKPHHKHGEHGKHHKGRHGKNKYAVQSREPDVDSTWNRNLDAFMRRYRWQLGIGGYVRAGYTAIQDDPGGVFGNHDGFGLANARLTLDGSLRKSAGFRFQIDGGVQRREAANDPNAEVVVRAKDMFIWWQPIRFAKLTVGQFKAPFDAEALASNADIPFVDRSVGSRGVRNVEGVNVNGLSRDREAGAMLSSRFHFGADRNKHEGFGVSYALAATNGRSAERALNDNDALAGYGRLGLHWAEMLSVGGAITINDRTLGIEPNTLEESLFGWTADLMFAFKGLGIFGSIIGITRDNEIQSEFNSLAFQGSISYKDPIFGFQPVFRYASYDPASTLDDDALNYITFGLNYIPNYPFRLLFNYTITGEEEPTTLTNNKLDVLLQVIW